MKNPLFTIVKKLLFDNKISFDKKELAFQIKSHPSYPSLHAITGVLDHFNIENIAAEVPTDSQTLAQLPDSFIAQIHTDKGDDLVAIRKIKKQSLYHVFSENIDEKMSESDFLIKFTGIIVAVEKDENVKPASKATFKKEILFSALGIILAALLYNKGIEYTNLAFLSLSILGIITSYSILKQELGESSVIGDAFCSGNNEKKDCDAVLSSKGAEIIKGHKLSDLGMIYFSGLLLASMLITNFSFLHLISFLAIPITIYSIYYQYKVVKSWCTLCLTIVGILWVQAALNSFQFTFTNVFPLDTDILVTTAAFISVYLIWSYTKPLVKSTIELEKEKIEFVKFKRDFNLFNNLLQGSSTVDTKISNTKEIILGNKDAALEVVIVTNPFCGHCRPVHEIVHSITEKYNDNVKIIIRFNVHVGEATSNGVIVTSKLLELYNEKGIEDCKSAMDDIYEGMDFDKWLSKWGKANNFDTYYDLLKDQKEWCTEKNINFTPEILVNGKSFPKEYNRTDLTFFIEDLEEWSLNTTPSYS